MKLLTKILELFAILVVKMFPLELLNKLIRLLPSSIAARLISSFDSLKVYEISLLGTDFIIESGPRDDHYLDLEKDQMRNWEHEVLTIWAGEVENAEVAIDIGAYLGVYSILAAKLGCPRVLAIEPNSKNFFQLERNLSINDLLDSVQSFQVALGAESRSVSIITPRGRPYSSGSQIIDSPTGRSLQSWESESDVQMVTLDSLLTAETGRISVMKIDAEGYEIFILQGAARTLKDSGPTMVIELLNYEHKIAVDTYLKKFGYGAGKPIETSKEATNFLYQK